MTLTFNNLVIIMLRLIVRMLYMQQFGIDHAPTTAIVITQANHFLRDNGWEEEHEG